MVKERRICVPLKDKKEGERVVDFYLIRERDISIAANGSEYMTFILGKGQQLTRGRLWDVSDEQKKSFHKRSVVKVDGIATVFRNQKHLNIQRIRLATEKDAVDIAELIGKPTVPREEMWHELRLMIEEIDSSSLKQIIKTLLGDKNVRDRFTTLPASKYLHHSHYAGLLEHTVTVCQAALHLLPLYPQLNKDVILSAAILHDIGMVKALSDPLAPDYTMSGELVGHLYLSCEMINHAAYQAGISVEDAELLSVKHCIISHRDKSNIGEGSPVLAKTAEALFLQGLIQINRQLQAVQSATKSSEELWVYSPLLNRDVMVGNDDK